MTKIVQKYWPLLHWIQHNQKNWWLWKYLQSKSFVFNISFCYGTFKKNDEKCLILDSKDKYEEVWSRIRSEIKTINGGI